MASSVYSGTESKNKAPYSGCESWHAPRALLIERGLIPDGPVLVSDQGPSDAERIAHAAKLWGRGISPIEPVMSGHYLRLRGITGPLDYLTLAHGWDFYHSEDYRHVEVMLALVEHAGLNKAVAVEITYLDLWRKLKAEPSRRTYGPKSGGGVWFGDRSTMDELIVGEGVETTFSAMEILGGHCGCASLSSKGMVALILPPNILHVHIAADNDANGEGQKAATTAQRRWVSEGRTVRISTPDGPDTDFNDILKAMRNV